MLSRNQRAYSKLHELTCAIQAADPEEFEHWEKLVRAAEAQEGGLNRNSSPQAIASTREAYDRFLARYPLFYGFWKRYADMEFAIAGPEAAEMVSTIGQ
jgi:pre-mRNA-processing factor 39